MANSGKMAPRNHPNYFEHPRAYNQLSQTAFESTSKREMGEQASICIGHKKTIIHLTYGPNPRFIVEVRTKKGDFFIETPCTFTPSMGIDALDGNLINDAEEWLLVQNLGKPPTRLRAVFGSTDRLPYQDYIKAVSFPHAGRGYEDLPPETESSTQNVRSSFGKTENQTKTTTNETSTVKKWWQFWK